MESKNERVINLMLEAFDENGAFVSERLHKSRKEARDIMETPGQYSIDDTVNGHSVHGGLVVLAYPVQVTNRNVPHIEWSEQ